MVTRARLIAPLALAAVSLTAASTLSRVLHGSSWVLPVVGAALLPHLVAALVRRRTRHPLVVVGVSTVAVVPYLVYALVPATTAAGFPGGATWHEIGHRLSAGLDALRAAPAPAAATPGTVMLAVVAVWFVAVVADAVAFDAGASLGAVVPGTVLVAWTTTVGADSGKLSDLAAFAAAATAFVAAQQRSRLGVGRSRLVSHETTTEHVAVAAGLLGAAAIAVALVVAPVLPGAGGDPLLDFVASAKHGSHGRSYEPHVAPFIEVGDQLTGAPNVELFTVAAPEADYWRVTALDDYSSANGGEWTLHASGSGEVRSDLPSDAPTRTGNRLAQDVRVTNLGERWLPAAYRPVAIDLAGTLDVTSSGTLVAAPSTLTGLHYRVVSQLPPRAGTITPAQVAATAGQLPASVGKYLATPAHLPPVITQTAQDVVGVAHASTPYAKAEALRDFFRSGKFTYDTSVRTGDNPVAIAAFLQDRRGFCVQFASAYALMARTLGIPSRVAVGFTPGTLRADGRYHVTSHDAHAWPEIYLTGLGWTHLFDPTPGRGPGVVGGSALPGEAGQSPAPAPAGVTTTTTAPSSSRPGNGSTGTTAPAPRPSVTAASRAGHDHLWVAVVVAVVGVLALVALALGLRAGARRRRRLRRRERPDATAAVEGAWEEALERLREAHVVPAPSWTPREIARRAPARTSRAAGPPLDALARLYAAARYGDRPMSPGDAERAWDAADVLDDVLRAGETRRDRWRREAGLAGRR